jgi:hypothetical protein
MFQIPNTKFQAPNNIQSPNFDNPSALPSFQEDCVVKVGKVKNVILLNLGLMQIRLVSASKESNTYQTLKWIQGD